MREVISTTRSSSGHRPLFPGHQSQRLHLHFRPDRHRPIHSASHNRRRRRANRSGPAQPIGNPASPLVALLEKSFAPPSFLKSMNDFAAMNQVYGKHFNSAPPARSTVEVARLPKDVLVEIDVIALE